MSEQDLPGFIYGVTKPSNEARYVCRLVITPNKEKGPGVDTSRKLDRDMDQSAALWLALELLKKCRGVPEELIAQVKALQEAAPKSTRR